ncbi:uncharacterized protein CLUP02_05310 [Colletotrichum lupini]|uniref:Uncharacterized protein n=1 Tax=Colletotrichum lupini TaxID=145971 RepID=A0A9Q8SMC9_9PEZI|nr:uncharacterized protein CLUP02_05310 [Colletotrichum lupini]UQC79830.1 hypothetical protein CLUP02_05310 [Colletotrichum lupini]
MTLRSTGFPPLKQPSHKVLDTWGARTLERLRLPWSAAATLTPRQLFCRCAAVVGAPAAFRAPHATSLVGRNLRIPSQTSDGGQRHYQETGAKQCRLSLAQHRFAPGTHGFHYFTQRFNGLAPILAGAQLDIPVPVIWGRKAGHGRLRDLSRAYPLKDGHECVSVSVPGGSSVVRQGLEMFALSPHLLAVLQAPWNAQRNLAPRNSGMALDVKLQRTKSWVIVPFFCCFCGVAILSRMDREPGSNNGRGALSETTQTDRLEKLSRTTSSNAVRMGPLCLPKDQGAIEPEPPGIRCKTSPAQSTVQTSAPPGSVSSKIAPPEAMISLEQEMIRAHLGAKSQQTDARCSTRAYVRIGSSCGSAGRYNHHGDDNGVDTYFLLTLSTSHICHQAFVPMACLFKHTLRRQASAQRSAVSICYGSYIVIPSPSISNLSSSAELYFLAPFSQRSQSPVFAVLGVMPHIVNDKVPLIIPNLPNLSVLQCICDLPGCILSLILVFPPLVPLVSAAELQIDHSIISVLAHTPSVTSWQSWPSAVLPPFRVAAFDSVAATAPCSKNKVAANMPGPGDLDQGQQRRQQRRELSLHFHQDFLSVFASPERPLGSYAPRTERNCAPIVDHAAASPMFSHEHSHNPLPPFLEIDAASFPFPQRAPSFYQNHGVLLGAWHCLGFCQKGNHGIPTNPPDFRAMTLGYHCPNRPHRMAGGDFGFIPIAGRDAYVMRWQAWRFWRPGRGEARELGGPVYLGMQIVVFPILMQRRRRGTVPPCPRRRAIYLMLDHLQLIDRMFLQAQGASLHQRWSDLAQSTNLVSLNHNPFPLLAAAAAFAAQVTRDVKQRLVVQVALPVWEQGRVFARCAAKAPTSVRNKVTGDEKQKAENNKSAAQYPFNAKGEGIARSSMTSWRSSSSFKHLKTENGQECAIDNEVNPRPCPPSSSCSFPLSHAYLTAMRRRRLCRIVPEPAGSNSRSDNPPANSFAAA